jgi:hypothetical protein
MATNPDTESKLKFSAKWLSFTAAIGAASLGLKNPTFLSTIGLSTSNDAVSWPLIVGGAVVFSGIRLANSDWLTRQNRTVREGIDRHVDAPAYTSYAFELFKNDLFQPARALIDKIEGYRRHELANTGKDQLPYGKNTLNIVHALALLGQDNSYDAQQLRSDPAFRHQVIQDIFNDSETLMQLMRPNETNLFQFAEAVRQSLGNDAQYILKNHKGDKHTTVEWRDIFNLVRDDTAREAQHANYHHHFTKTITVALRYSVNGELTPERANLIAARLDKFKTPLANEPKGSEQHKTAALAVSIGNRLRRLARNERHLLDFHKLDTFKSPGVRLDLIAGFQKTHKLSGDKLIMMTKEALLPWVKSPEMKPVHSLFTERLFKTLTKRAKDKIDEAGYTDKSHYAHTDRDYALSRVTDLGMKKGTTSFDDFTPEDAAEHVIKKVQQRVARTVANKQASYEPDPEKAASIPRRR